MGQLLIVDDDAVSRLVLRHMLERQDHVVIEADSVDSALAASTDPTSEPFDMVICDYQMPNRTGLDLLEALADKRLPFILLTGELHEGDLQDERVQFVTAYLTKPVASGELEQVVLEYMPNHRSTGRESTATTLG